MSHSQSIDYTQNSGHVYHVSEETAISRFEPRPIRPDHPLHPHSPVVWAIGPRLLHNYLLPRNCPRVTFYAGPLTTADDAARFLGHTDATHVVAIESVWLDLVLSTPLTLYTLPAEGFACIDLIADYWVSDTAVSPAKVEHITRPPTRLTTRNVELRVVPSLWPLRDAVLDSTLSFSFIRMAHAAPRP